MERIIVGKDPVLVDTYGVWLLGYSKDETVPRQKDILNFLEKIIEGK